MTESHAKSYRAGAIGPLQTLFGCGKQDRRGGGDDLAVLGPHVLNLMRYFAGEPQSVWAHITEDGQPVAAGDGREASEPVGLVAGDAASAIFRFENGVSGIFESRADQPGKGAGYGLEIIGQDGRITLQSATVPVVTLFPNTAWPPADYHANGTPSDSPPGDAREGNAHAVRDLIAAIEEDRDPIASGRDAIPACIPRSPINPPSPVIPKPASAGISKSNPRHPSNSRATLISTRWVRTADSLKNDYWQPRHPLEMPVESEQVTTTLHCLRSYPYVVYRNRRALLSQSRRNHSKSVTCPHRHRQEFYKRIFKERIQITPVSVVAVPFPKTENQLAHHHCR